MNFKNNQDTILNGNIYKAILLISFPIIFNNLIQTLYNLVDGFWISKIGSLEFAATTFVWPVNFLFISIGMGISIAGTAILSQLLGADEKDDANKYASQLIMLCIATGTILMLFGVVFSRIIVKIMGVEGKMLYYGTLYLRLTFLDLPFMFYFFIFNAIMNSQGNSVVPTVLSGISAVINAILDPILIFNFNMGVSGAAIATIIAKVLLALACGIYLLKGKSIIQPNFKKFKFNKQIIEKSLKIAIPSAIGQSGSAIGFIFLNTFIVSYGTSTMAAYGMVNRITALISQPALGISTAIISIVGQNFGARNYKRATDSFKKSILLTSAIGIIGCVFLIWQRVRIINFFMQSKDSIDVINQGITYLVYISFSMPLMGIFSSFQGLFQGSGQTKYAMAMEISRLWFVRLPMILFFKYFTSFGSEAIWFSMSFSNLIICIYGYIIYKKRNWMNNLIR
ncbi:putative MATE family efflux protein [Sedimentibacter acidaminivorans]|uniref:MATE family efflux protein n=1 Tax=Sedimentibacter acidaminivorans TaxID=913099 RepID=A0ABS4G9I1_9FIRM|nr:MATE family efflux transporter [Sedimentibacter acidaminivorans]MBP1924340.1 putative MATE family efflux protein [Sedimentibacter acidaminivorans]